MAEALRNWLPNVIQAVDPWMSNEDIKVGSRWFSEVSGELEASKFGIVCVTPENQHNPWIMFEAGALSKTIKQTYVCPYLIDIEKSQLTGPLSQFQSSSADKEGTYQILQTLNHSLGDHSLSDSRFAEIFSVWWPKLEEKVKNLPELDGEHPEQRTINDMVAEILNNTREQLRREDIRLRSSTEMDQKFNQLVNHFDTYTDEVKKFDDYAKAIQGILAKYGIDRENLNTGNAKILKAMMSQVKDMQDIGESSTQELLKANQIDNTAEEI